MFQRPVIGSVGPEWLIRQAVGVFNAEPVGLFNVERKVVAYESA